MARCLMMDEEEPSENCEEEREQNGYFRIFQLMEQFDAILKLLKGKKSEEEEEELVEYYNVGVYRILPYPPNTKETKDFFIQKT